jgi:hypothetical protein
MSLIHQRWSPMRASSESVQSSSRPAMRSHSAIAKHKDVRVTPAAQVVDGRGARRSTLVRRRSRAGTMTPGWRRDSRSRRRVEKVVGYPPLVELDDLRRREFHEALLEAATFEDLPGKWQAAILEAEQNRPNLRVVTSD